MTVMRQRRASWIDLAYVPIAVTTFFVTTLIYLEPANLAALIRACTLPAVYPFWNYLGLGSRVTTVIKGDVTCLAVAAASCVAKVTRDRMMVAEAEHFPPYGFESNVGYPAPVHKTALRGSGPSAAPRRPWSFVSALCWPGVPPAPGRGAA